MIRDTLRPKCHSASEEEKLFFHCFVTSTFHQSYLNEINENVRITAVLCRMLINEYKLPLEWSFLFSSDDFSAWRLSMVEEIKRNKLNDYQFMFNYWREKEKVFNVFRLLSVCRLVVEAAKFTTINYSCWYDYWLILMIKSLKKQ